MRAREFSPYLIFAGLVWVPLMILPYDMFDGAIIQYASQVDDCSGLKIWFLEANYYLEYPLHCAIISVAKVLQMPYLTINGIFILLVGWCLLREVSLFSRVELKLSSVSALAAPLLVSAAPVWSTLVASVLTFYFFCLTLGLLSVRLIHQRRAFATTIGFLLLGASFQYTSLLVFLPVLSYAYDVLRKTPEDRNFPLPGWRTSCIFGVAVISYVVFRLLLSPSGVYEGYNNFEFPATLGEIMGLVNHGVRFTTFGLPLVIIVGLLAIAFAAFGRPGDSADALIGRRALPILFIVCIAAAIPYVVVGKSTTLISIWGWNARHGFLLAVATAFFTGGLLHCLGMIRRANWQRRLTVIGLVCILGVNLTLLSYGMIYKLNRQIFLEELGQKLLAIEEEISPGYLQIVGDGLPGPPVRTWEANLLMFSIAGKAQWWTHIGNKFVPDWTIPEFLSEAEAYRTKYVFDYPIVEPLDNTLISISVDRFDGREFAIKNVLSYVLSGQSRGSVEIRSISSS